LVGGLILYGAKLNQRKVPPGRVLHQSQSPPQIPSDRLAHVAYDLAEGFFL